VTARIGLLIRPILKKRRDLSRIPIKIDQKNKISLIRGQMIRLVSRTRKTRKKIKSLLPLLTAILILDLPLR
jgi:hypothetical protein